jgi:hypothetical protein
MGYTHPSAWSTVTSLLSNQPKVRGDGEKRHVGPQIQSVTVKGQHSLKHRTTTVRDLLRLVAVHGSVRLQEELWGGLGRQLAPSGRKQQPLHALRRVKHVKHIQVLPKQRSTFKHKRSHDNSVSELASLNCVCVWGGGELLCHGSNWPASVTPRAAWGARARALEGNPRRGCSSTSHTHIDTYTWTRPDCTTTHTHRHIDTYTDTHRETQTHMDSARLYNYTHIDT